MLQRKSNFLLNYVLMLLMVVFTVNWAQSQICDGNLGENIFTSGDFGAGIPNLVALNPNIAPGYQYTTNVPPPDGLYTITNNTGAWPALYSTWLMIQDNSPDPNGYMMVVNASFNTGIFYEQTIDNLCENTLYEFSADVINLIQVGVGGHIMPNVSFLLDEQVVYETGNIPQTNAWNTYGFTFTTDPGVTSITLSLRNNAPGGIGNDLALDNITFRPCGPAALILPTEIENICEEGDPIPLEATIIGDQYPTPAIQWQQSFDEGLTWVDISGETAQTYIHTQLSGGFYYYRYLLANSPFNLANSKCRVNSNVKIVHVVPKFYTIIDSICQGLSFMVGNSLYSDEGIYTDSLISSLGCDSIVTLDLTIIPDQGITTEFAIDDPGCAGFMDGGIILDPPKNAYPPYVITLGDETPISEGVYANLGAGSYLLNISDRFGCTFEETIIINDPATFTVDLGPDLLVDLGDAIQIQPLANYPIMDFAWSPQEGFFCEDDCLNLEWVPTSSNLYTLQATSENGCMASDSIFIQVEEVRKVYLPNAFSPNSDGINDYFAAQADFPNVQRIIEMKVFNRWGGLVFDQAEIPLNLESGGWDGTYLGKPAETGIYVYLLKVVFLDNAELIFSGDVLLVR